MGLYNAGALDHRGLGLGSMPSGHSPDPFPPEYGQFEAGHDQSFQCMHSIVRRFLPTYLFLSVSEPQSSYFQTDPGQNAHSTYVSTHRPRLEASIQRGASDNYLARAGNGSLREGNARVSEALMKPGGALCRLRQVSELRPCS